MIEDAEKEICIFDADRNVLTPLTQICVYKLLETMLQPRM